MRLEEIERAFDAYQDYKNLREEHSVLMAKMIDLEEEIDENAYKLAETEEQLQALGITLPTEETIDD